MAKKKADPVKQIIAELESALESIKTFCAYPSVPECVKLDLCRKQISAAHKAVETIAFPVIMADLKKPQRG